MPSPALPSGSSVLILKSDRLYAELLRQFTLRFFPRARIEIVASVAAASTAMAACPPDFLITGIGATLEGDVVELLANTMRQPARPRVIVVTARKEYRMLTTLRALGISGVFDSSSEAPDAFIAALQKIAAGERYWSESFLEHLVRHAGPASALLRLLSIFEQMVLSVVGSGCDDEDAAKQLGVNKATIAAARRELHRKLDVQHRGELVRIAAQQGFVRFTPTGIVRPGFSLLTASYRARRPHRPAPATQSSLCGCNAA